MADFLGQDLPMRILHVFERFCGGCLRRVRFELASHVAIKCSVAKPRGVQIYRHRTRDDAACPHKRTINGIHIGHGEAEILRIS